MTGKPKAARKLESADARLLRDCRDAMRTALAEWSEPDSPEGVAFALKALQTLCDRIEARQGIETK